jgi:glycosyltransferase involved in cell wall biosynthesis
MRVAIVARISSADDIGIFGQLVPILKTVVQNLYLIADGSFNDLRATQPNQRLRLGMDKDQSVVARLVEFVCFQLRTTKIIVDNSRRVDVLLFHLGTDLVVPIGISRLIGKRTVMMTSGSFSRSLKAIHKKPLLMALIAILEKSSYLASGKIIAYTPRCIEYFGLGRFKRKILIANSHFLDLAKFRIQKHLASRENIIGYLGRLSEEKGVLNLIEAMKLVRSRGIDARLLVIGDGPLEQVLKNYIHDASLEEDVEMLGWLPHDDLPPLLNRMRLLVMPSYTEGLPNAILEAMACGTPVLATPVGGVPDVIRDSVTGFIMEDPSPECIANNIQRALAYPNLQNVTERANALVANEYNFQKKVEDWSVVIDAILK